MSLLANPKLILFIGISLLLGGGYLYVTHLQSVIEVQRNNNIRLTDAAEEQARTIVSLKEDYTKIIVLNAELKNTTSTQQKKIQELNNTFNIKANGYKRDFGAITRAKPKLINKIVNTGTARVNRCFEIITGSEPTKKEKTNAKKYPCSDIIGTYIK